MTSKEVAINLIKYYVLRGDSVTDLRKSQLGCFCKEYGAMIGGYANGKRYSDKIIVSKINGVECNYIFDLQIIYNEIKGGQLSLLKL